mmetsp:Transcript_34879/g.46111  ORF Transcript_34879/g.46111 Transcript_34879/m.46111 type:complete len:183 (+) Transcript_34879:83-631(+)
MEAKSASITVAEEGNRRTGNMDVQEFEQCVLDIVSWFEDKSNSKEDKGSSLGGVEGLEKALGITVPEEAEKFLTQVNTGVWLYEKTCLTSEGAADAASGAEGSGKWQEGLIPIASDLDNNLLVLDTNTTGLKVCEWDPEGGLGSCVSSSFSAYLENYRNLLLSGKCQFIEDAGVVEEMKSGK